MQGSYGILHWTGEAPGRAVYQVWLISSNHQVTPEVNLASPESNVRSAPVMETQGQGSSIKNHDQPCPKGVYGSGVSQRPHFPRRSPAVGHGGNLRGPVCELDLEILALREGGLRGAEPGAGSSEGPTSRWTSRSTFGRPRCPVLEIAPQPKMRKAVDGSQGPVHGRFGSIGSAMPGGRLARTFPTRFDVKHFIVAARACHARLRLFA
jgi:hypothetical protein